MDHLRVGIESILTGANASLELEGSGTAWVLADQLRGLVELHQEQVRGHVTVAADEETREVRLGRDDGDARTLRVDMATVPCWELATAAGRGADRPQPIAAYLAEWLRCRAAE